MVHSGAPRGARRRFPLALLWPTGLVLLVGVLAFFQYKWLGQVSESERDRLRASLNQRAREFADDFDREIGRVYASLQINDELVTAKNWEPFAVSYDQWKEASKFPQIVRNIYLTSDAAAESAPLLQFDPGARTFLDATWPPELQPVRDRIRPFTNVFPDSPTGLPAAVKFMATTTTPVIASVPAILVPIQNTEHVMNVGRGNMMTFRMGPGYVIIELDRAFITNTMLPVLVARHFAIDDYHVAVTESRAPETALYTRGITPGATIKERDADASTTFFSIHIDSVRQAVAGLSTVGSSPTALVAAGSSARLSTSSTGRFSIVVQDRAATESALRSGNLQFGGGAWQIALQHPAGSLEAAVSRARVRNLSLSFGVLAVLTAGVFLISINAQRAQRLAAQQMDFVATVSHELRTPLAVIRSAAQNLSAGVVHEPAQAKRYGELIDAEGRRLTDMVEQVLTYAGLTDSNRPMSKVPTDLVFLTNDVVASCDSLIREAGFTVDVTAADNIPDVPVDDGAFRRALNNLIVNALKYGTDGRWVGVNVATGHDKSGIAEVQVSVTDRGRGIDPSELPHIFEAFYRGEYAKERQIHGNGLGLSLVKGIADAHGGRVTVKSSPGAGATFTLHLPI